MKLVEKLPEDLDEAAEEYATTHLHNNEFPTADSAFKAGAKWQAEQLLKSSPLPEDTVIFQKGVEEGKRLMMENALDGVAHPDDCEIWVNLIGYSYDIKDGDNVKVIVIKED